MQTLRPNSHSKPREGHRRASIELVYLNPNDIVASAVEATSENDTINGPKIRRALKTSMRGKDMEVSMESACNHDSRTSPIVIIALRVMKLQLILGLAT